MRRVRSKAVFLPVSAMVVLGLSCQGGAAVVQGMGFDAERSGFVSLPPGLGAAGNTGVGGGDDFAGEILRKLTVGLSSSLFYNSNVAAGLGNTANAANPVGGDVVSMLSSNVGWSLVTSSWSVALNANGTYGKNFNESAFDQQSYGVGGTAAYRGGRFNASLNLNHTVNEGPNFLFGGVLRNLGYSIGLSGSYVLSPKTDLVSSLAFSWNQPDGDFGSIANRLVNVSAMWRYSSLLRCGPGLSFGNASGDLQPTRTTVGPTLSADYKLSSKVSLNGRVGLDFVNFGGVRSDPAFSTMINGAYQFNTRRGMSLSLSRGVLADGFLVDSFNEMTALNVSLNQKVGRSLTAAVGFGYQQSDFLTSSDAGPRPGLDMYTGNVSLALPLLGNQASAMVFIRYMDMVSADVLQNWDSLQTGVSINFNF